MGNLNIEKENFVLILRSGSKKNQIPPVGIENSPRSYLCIHGVQQRDWRLSDGLPVNDTAPSDTEW